ncbi:MAG: hypothetical protein ACYCOU_03055 [Sulfobacillus sp.]
MSGSHETPSPALLSEIIRELKEGGQDAKNLSKKLGSSKNHVNTVLYSGERIGLFIKDAEVPPKWKLGPALYELREMGLNA